MLSWHVQTFLGIYRIMHELPWITIFWSGVRRFANDFHEWRSQSWKSLRNHITSDFLHAILCPEHTITLKTIIDCSIHHCRQGRPFLTCHCDITTVDLWRHTNKKYWHCEVIFIDCSCTRKLAQRRSSLVNNNREYRFLTTQYSRRVRNHCHEGGNSKMKVP